jgi:hypothetical protein
MNHKPPLQTGTNEQSIALLLLTTNRLYDVVESMSPQRTLLKSICVSGWLARMSSGLPSVALQGPASPLSIQFMKSPSLFQMEKMRTEPRSRARPWASRPPRRRPSVLLASQYSWALLVCGKREKKTGGHGKTTHVGDAVQALVTRGSRSHSVLDRLVPLPVRAADIDQASGSGVVVGDELRGDGELLRGIDHVLRPSTEVLGLAQSVRVEAASPLIADSVESALFALAAVDAFDAAGVGGEAQSSAVRFPDVHLVAARSQGVGVDRAVKPKT